MKKKLLNNIGLKLLSIVLAVMLWMFVTIVSDYTVKVEILDIPVTQLNGEKLDQLDQIYDVVSGDTVDIVVKGRRSVVSELKASDFVATADLSTMSITNSVQINVNAKRQDINDEISITCVDNCMILNLEKKIKQQYPVKVNVIGEPLAGYAVSNTLVTPNIVTIEGPQSSVSRITEVYVEADVEGHKESFSATSDIKLLDAYGETIENDKISINQTAGLINIDIYPVKTVPLEVSVVGTPLAGYGVNEVIYQQKEVVIVGEKGLLDQIDKIVVDNLSVTGHNDDIPTSVNLADYMPNGVKLVSPLQDVLVAIDIEPVNERFIMLSDKDITLFNTNVDYEYKINLSGNAKVKILGMEKKIKDIAMANIAPRVDCSGLYEGEHNVSLVFSNSLGVTYELIGDVTVDVISKNAATEAE